MNTFFCKNNSIEINYASISWVIGKYPIQIKTRGKQMKITDYVFKQNLFDRNVILECYCPIEDKTYNFNIPRTTTLKQYVDIINNFYTENINETTRLKALGRDKFIEGIYIMHQAVNKIPIISFCFSS